MPAAAATPTPVSDAKPAVAEKPETVPAPPVPTAEKATAAAPEKPMAAEKPVTVPPPQQMAQAPSPPAPVEPGAAPAPTTAAPEIAKPTPAASATPAMAAEAPPKKMAAPSAPAASADSKPAAGVTDVAVVRDGDGLHLTVPARHVNDYAAAAGQAVLLGIRPEDIYESQANPDWQPIDITVVAVEALGVENIVVGQLGRERPIELSARLSRHFTAEIGATIRLYVDAMPMHLFDPESGKVHARTPLAAVPPLTLVG